MRCVLAAGAAVLGEGQFFRSLGLIALGNIVEIAADGAFQT